LGKFIGSRRNVPHTMRKSSQFRFGRRSRPSEPLDVIRTLRERGPDALKRFKARVGWPARMMLAERLPGAEAIIAWLGRCAVESKLDGFRCQVHVHTCAQDEEGIGLALRFPRLVGFIRKDKSPEDATTFKEIKEMFAMQKKRRKR
jgi:ATP-dependent DNA ligase